MKIAICSPSRNTYSETFIRAHRDLLQGQILFYHTGLIPQYLGDKPLVLHKHSLKSIFRRFKQLIKFKGFPVQDFNFYDSLKKNRPDVVLVEYGPTAVTVLPIVKLLGIPLVVHFHGYDATIKEIIERHAKGYVKVFKYASSIISVSKVMSQKLIGLGCPENKIVQTCCGPNNRFFELKPLQTEPVFFGVGRLVEKKAPHLTIMAFSEVIKDFPKAKLRIAGKGPLLSVCEDLVKYLKLENSVKFLGVLSHEKVMEEMSKSRALVQHSKTADNGDMEGTPVGVLEAQAAALPVISTFHAGIPEIVVHGKTGFLVEEGDISGMRDYMLKILNSPEEAKSMGESGRKRIKEFFTIDTHISILQKAIENAIH